MISSTFRLFKFIAENRTKDQVEGVLSLFFRAGQPMTLSALKAQAGTLEQSFG